MTCNILGAFWRRIVHVRVMESFIPLVTELEETAILGKMKSVSFS